jgi:hypothetical protein
MLYKLKLPTVQLDRLSTPDEYENPLQLAIPICEIVAPVESIVMESPVLSDRASSGGVAAQEGTALSAKPRIENARMVCFRTL